MKEEESAFDYFVVEWDGEAARVAGCMYDKGNYALLQRMAPCRARQHRRDGQAVAEMTMERKEEKTCSE